jgi:hypothetical protein
MDIKQISSFMGHNEQGLKLNNTVIHKISGPSSYYIFLPNKENSILPIQILFGDIHKGFENPCEDEKGRIL